MIFLDVVTSTNCALNNRITASLSDWHVANKESDIFVAPKPDVDGYANYEIEVQYNVYGRDFDKVAVVMYASDSTSANDGEGNWHIVAGDANADGTLKEGLNLSVSGNSIDNGAISRSLPFVFPATGGDPVKMIDRVEVLVFPLKNEENSVPLVPKGDFGL